MERKIDESIAEILNRIVAKQGYLTTSDIDYAWKTKKQNNGSNAEIDESSIAEILNGFIEKQGYLTATDIDYALWKAEKQEDEENE